MCREYAGHVFPQEHTSLPSWLPWQCSITHGPRVFIVKEEICQIHSAAIFLWQLNKWWKGKLGAINNEIKRYLLEWGGCVVQTSAGPHCWASLLGLSLERWHDIKLAISLRQRWEWKLRKWSIHASIKNHPKFIRRYILTYSFCFLIRTYR